MAESHLELDGYVAICTWKRNSRLLNLHSAQVAMGKSDLRILRVLFLHKKAELEAGIYTYNDLPFQSS